MLLRERQILQLIPVSRATLRRWLRDGSFPPSFKLSKRISVWRVSDVQDWILNRTGFRGGLLA